MPGDRAGRRWLVAWRVCRRLPGPVAFALGRAGGYLFYRLDRGRRTALRANLARVLGPATAPAALDRAVRANFAAYGRYWVEAFRLEDLHPAELRRRLRLDGREHLDRALAASQAPPASQLPMWGLAKMAPRPAARAMSMCSRPSMRSRSRMEAAVRSSSRNASTQ